MGIMKWMEETGVTVVIATGKEDRIALSKFMKKRKFQVIGKLNYNEE